MMEMANLYAEIGDILIFFVNGKKVMEHRPDPEMTLLTYLRTQLHLTGSKLGCGEGRCGACTVMVSRYNADTDTIYHHSLNACLAPLCSLHGAAVTTVEGIGTVNNLHPVQERIARFHGSQCGFCTPGMVMSMYTLIRNNPQPSALAIEEYLDGNLCRCTGYRSILDGFRTFSKEFTCGLGEDCCQNVTKKCNGSQSTVQQVIGKDLKPYDASQEIIFPPELKIKHESYHGRMLSFQGPNVRWFQPRTLQQLLHLRTQFPDTKVIAGNTEIGIQTKFKNQVYPVYVSTSSIPELSRIQVSNQGITFGASVTLSQMDIELKKLVQTEKDYKTRSFHSVVEMLKWIANHQTRNVATVGGNIVSASTNSDLIPLFLAAGVTVVIAGKDGAQRVVPLDNKFFCGFHKTAMDKDDILVSLTIPFTHQNEYFSGFKQANRKYDDISLVNAGMFVRLDDSNQIENVTIAFGGMGPMVVVAQKTMDGLLGDSWDESLVAKACHLLASDLPLSPGSPGGMVEFRQTLAVSFFFKFYVQVDQESQLKQCSDISAISSLDHDISRGIQVYGAQDSRERINQVVGQPIMHHAAFQQSTGEATYIDDMPMTVDELYMGLVTSTKASAKIISIDPSEALKSVGVTDFVSASDIPGKNKLDNFMDEIFSENEVTCQGQVIGAILADTQAHARKAARLVSVEYEERTPIITIKDAIKNNSFFDGVVRTDFGDLESGFQASDHILEGEVYINGQVHFYLETCTARAIPLENGEMEVFSSTQSLAFVQSSIASALGVSASKICVRTKRMGGGFGGKETNSVVSAVPAAIAARKLNRTVRCILDRDEDMMMTGNRHPFLGQYKVGFKLDGTVMALDLKMYCNGGNTLDFSNIILKKAILQMDYVYHIPSMRVIGQVCRTNIVSNTACRGFGIPQGHFILETVLEHVASFLGKDQEEVQGLNLLRPGQETRLNLNNQEDMIQHCWNSCKEKSDFYQRKKDIEEYNRKNRWLKKGIALTPLQFGISFGARFLNQAGALIHIYQDGSVLIAHGGTEMGQGLHVKVMQVASEVLQLPMSKIHISETSTNTVPNATPTAASFSTDLYGMAVKIACEVLKTRLEPYKKQNPDGKWEDWVTAAYFDAVSLSTTGFYRSPDMNYDMETQKGKPFEYFTIGAACAEVQIDCLTGDHKVLRVDIVMDVGQSINPAIDVGQIQGAFMQGYGLYLLEEVKVTPEGCHLTQGPGNYKIPSFRNIPTQFNVSLVPDSQNPFAIYSSKGVGEPPLLLAVSSFFAVKNAIKSARRDCGENIRFDFNSPAVPAAIRMACCDQFAKRFPEADKDSYTPWFVQL